MMKEDKFKLFGGFDLQRTDRQTDGRTDICVCRVAFATEKVEKSMDFCYFTNALG